MPEQTFLGKHYDENAKKSDRDPRGAFRNPADAAAGIVGPLGSSSFSLPNVERALSEMESSTPPIQAAGPTGGAAANPTTAGGRLAGTRPAALSGRSTSGLPPAAAGLPPTSRTPTSPSSSQGAAAAAGGQSQHQVLQDFFQSLLNTKGSAGTPRKATNGAAAANGSAEDKAS